MHAIAFAGPTSDDASIAGNEPTTAIRVPPATSASGSSAGSSSGNQALDLLVQMQSQTASIAPQQNRPGAMRGQGIVVAPTPAATNGNAMPQQPSPPSANSPLFGSGATPGPRSGDSREEAYRSSNGRSSAGPERSDAKPPSAAEEPRWLFGLPVELMIYVRENREWFLAGALGALALVWVGSTALARRRA